MKTKKRYLKKNITKFLITILILSIPFTLWDIFIIILQFILINILYFRGNREIIEREG